MNEAELENKIENILGEITAEKEFIRETLLTKLYSLDSNKSDEAADVLLNLLKIVKRQENVLKNIRKGNNKEAFSELQEIIEELSNINLGPVYNYLDSNNIVDKKQLHKFDMILKNSEKMEEDLLKHLVNHSETTDKRSYRPTIIFRESVLNEIYRNIAEIQIENGDEFSGLLKYKRVEEGLEIVQFDLETEALRSNGATALSKEKQAKLADRSQKFIHFHSHPYVVGDTKWFDNENLKPLGDNLRPSSRDIYGSKDEEFHEVGFKDGICVIGYPAPKFMRNKSHAGLFAFSIYDHGDKYDSNTWIYLPISVKGLSNISKKYPEIAAYNFAVKKAIENNERSKSPIQRSKNLMESIKNYWKREII